tara:strand:+ start:1678 stop:1953 length:276 start_codon:yes stop_codon:yes gene_type:complete
MLLRDFWEACTLIGRIFNDPEVHKCPKCGALLLAEDQEGRPVCPDCCQETNERSADQQQSDERSFFRSPNFALVVYRGKKKLIKQPRNRMC